MGVMARRRYGGGCEFGRVESWARRRLGALALETFAGKTRQAVTLGLSHSYSSLAGNVEFDRTMTTEAPAS